MLFEIGIIVITFSLSRSKSRTESTWESLVIKLYQYNVTFPSRLCSTFQKFCWVLLHPHSLITIVVIAYTLIMFPNESYEEILFRGITATKQAFVYGIVDFMIYGNWLFGVTCMVFISNWFCFWYMSWYRPSVEEVAPKTEKVKVD